MLCYAYLLSYNAQFLVCIFIYITLNVSFMAKFLKKVGDNIVSKFNFNIKRKLNNKKVVIPVINGVKVGVSGEKWMSGVLKEVFKYASDGTFYDVGINLGQTMIKVMTLNENISYVGFEPNPSCLFYLQYLISANKWSRNIIVPVALSDADHLLPLYGSSDTDPESTIIRELQQTRDVTPKMVPVFRYESIANDISNKKVSVIKVDVEGAELDVIDSLRTLINKDRPTIIMEILPNERENTFKSIRNKKLIRLMKDLQYSFYRIIKTSNDSYAGVSAVDNVGDYDDPVMKDHIAFPNEDIIGIKNFITIL